MSFRSLGMKGAAWVTAILFAGLAGAGCGSDNGGTNPGTDDQAPVITEGPTVSSLTETSARITWTTNEAATSAVDFGLSTAYGSSQTASELSTTHTVMVSDLTPYTAYHCRVVSTDASGNVVTSSDVIFTTDRDFGIYMSDGWTWLAAGDVASARSSFTSAMEKIATSAGPHLGLGWCDRMSGDLADAYTEFYACEALNPGGLDALAARAVVGADRGEWAQSILDASAVLDANPEYSFPSVEAFTAFDYNDLRVTLARCYFAQGDYPAAQNQVDVINPHNQLDTGAEAYPTMLNMALNSLYREFVDLNASDGGKPSTSAAESGS